MNQPANMYVNVEVISESGEKLVEERMSKEYVNRKRIDKLHIGQVVGFQSSFEIWNRLDRINCQQSMAKALQLSNQFQAIKKRLRFN